MSVKRDYKHTASSSARRRTRRLGLLVIVLLLLGLAGAGAAWLKGYRVATPPPAAATDPSPAAEAPPPVKPPAAAATGPKYDFYQVLPERELDIGNTPQRPIAAPPAARPADPVPERAAQPEPPSKPPSRPTPAADGGPGFVIQAGAFHNPQDAERRRANLALLGLSAHVETARDADNRLLHRVRIGPVRGSAQRAAVERKLQTNGIKSIAIRVP